MLATTATANARVTADVAEQLGDALVLRGSLDRESLRLAVLELPNPAHRLAWLADHLDRLPGSGIIYTLTVAAATETAEFLRSRGYAVASYTGQAEDADRRAAEQDLLDNQIKALVATSALGHGLRQARPRLRRAPRRAAVADRLLPAGRPRRPRRRARRGGAAARRARTPPSGATSPRWRSRRRSRSARCWPPCRPDRPLSTPALEPLVDLRRTRLELMLKVLDVDGAVRRTRGGWIATGEPWTYDTARLRRVAEARTAEQQSHARVREHDRLPDGVPAPLPRRPGGAALRPLRQLRRAAVRRRGLAGALAAAQAFLGRPGVEIAPKKLWPTGLAPSACR